MIGIQATSANLLPPPDGPGKDIASIQKLLSEWAAENPEAVKKVGWIAASATTTHSLRNSATRRRRISIKFPQIFQFLSSINLGT